MLTTTKSRTPTLRDPFQSLFQLFSDSDAWLGHGLAGGNQTVAPLANISETDTAYELAFELPGLQESDIQVDLHDHTLTVSAERKDTREAQSKADENDQPKRKWHRVEHRYGRFVRAISLPRDAANDQVDAVYENGVLTVTVAKAPEAQARRIAVRKA